MKKILPLLLMMGCAFATLLSHSTFISLKHGGYFHVKEVFWLDLKGDQVDYFHKLATTATTRMEDWKALDPSIEPVLKNPENISIMAVEKKGGQFGYEVIAEYDAKLGIPLEKKGRIERYGINVSQFNFYNGQIFSVPPKTEIWINLEGTKDVAVNPDFIRELEKTVWIRPGSTFSDFSLSYSIEKPLAQTGLEYLIPYLLSKPLHLLLLLVLLGLVIYFRKDIKDILVGEEIEEI